MIDRTATAPLPDPSAARPRRALRGLLAVLAAAVLLAFAALPRIEAHYLERAGASDRATLRLATEVLRGALERTEALPALIAERPILVQLLREPENAGLVPFTNELLRQSALSLDVSDIYVMDLEGRTVATSNYRSEASFLGRNFAFRPYFTEALSEGVGRFHALGTTSNQRGYFFAAPVIAETERLGVVAVKITLDGYEETWANSESTIIVTDTSNVIFLSDRPDWHFRTLGPVPEPAIEAIAATRQYPLDALQPLQARRTPLGPDMERMTVTDAEGGAEDFVFQTALIAAPGWRVSILTPTAPAIAQAWTVLGLVLLLIVVSGLIAAVVVQRRAQLMERLARQHSQQAELEARVRDRTRDLDEANARLRGEVEERRAAEERLRRTQAELVQAGKLAALGQMSAALSHEFNQPLAAVKSYADNAATFLDRGRAAEARENVGRISAMADRMATISRHLRNFARRPQDKTGPVPLGAVIADALELMQPRLSKAGAEVRHLAPDPETWVLGGRVRLQQVIVNLLSNALDAMADNDVPRIEMALISEGGPEDGTCRLDVRDHGPGLSKDALAQAFDPFFTTKEPGQGLGLGLSISYNIVRDFDGRLSVLNHPEGGAVFSVTLRRSAAPAETQGGMAAE
ncbi:ATP-binding protein [Roseibacterium sp. SDUM158016]|uniref:sensor histidine kinase n=1 Tax=Roseicyclus sediminis TaxID=2980997 RepID=UPI0021D278D7|nr:ATP-binding protein [Roseibacterium sp. SDUM158016]MCU4651769.1 ATP-binding protein [Roseibacterium sp. SDUM158016]